MAITALDHLVLTVADIDASIRFYTQVLGMAVVTFGDNRKALQFGKQKINLHQKHHEIKPNARHADTGTADLCLLTDTPLIQVMDILTSFGVEILQGGIVDRTGAVGRIRSVYCYDPDGNLLEISQYATD
ncbi:VOC family protein [Moraxella sp. ZJ142]|uniref:VOC family protein n=1 Tax=Moraxella marmotae TaxID=3344520 RepID=UPI0035D4AC50